MMSHIIIYLKLYPNAVKLNIIYLGTVKFSFKGKYDYVNRKNVPNANTLYLKDEQI